MIDFNTMTDAQIDVWASEHDVDLGACPDRRHKIMFCVEADRRDAIDSVCVDDITCKVDVGALSSYDALKMLNDFVSGDTSPTDEIACIAFGADEWKRILDELAERSGGTASAVRVISFLQDVLIESGIVKN